MLYDPKPARYEQIEYKGWSMSTSITTTSDDILIAAACSRTTASPVGPSVSLTGQIKCVGFHRCYLCLLLFRIICCCVHADAFLTVWPVTPAKNK